MVLVPHRAGDRRLRSERRGSLFALGVAVLALACREEETGAIETTLPAVYAAYRVDGESADHAFQGRRLEFEAEVKDIEPRRFPSAMDLKPPPGEQEKARALLRKGATTGSDRFHRGAVLPLSCIGAGWDDGAPRFKDCTLAH